MSWQLMNFVDSMIGPMGEIQSQLSQFASLHRDAHMRLRSQAASLVNAGGLDLFTGDGAAAYSNAIEQYIAVSERNMQAIDQAINATNNCINDILGAVASASTAFLDEGIVGEILSKLTHDDVIQNGGQSVMDIIQNMVNAVGNMAGNAGGFFGNLFTLNFGGAWNNITSEFSDTGQLIGDAWNLLGDIPRVLTQWADDIYNTVKGWVSAIKDFISALFFYSPHVTKGVPTNGQTTASDNFDKHPNMLTLAQKIASQEKSNNPIAIQTVGNNTILVTLAGTDPGNAGWDTNLADALDAGAGDKNNPYLQDANAAIEQYIKDNHLPAGTQVIVAGHSLGGMEAEYLAENNGTTNYTVSQVITFGSPQIDNQNTGAQYHQYFNQYDPITLVSWYEIEPLVEQYGWAGAVAKLYQINTGDVQAKTQFIHETLVHGNPNNIPQNPGILDWIQLQDHNYSHDTLLQSQTITINSPTLGPIDTTQPITYYSGTPQNQAADWARFGEHALGDIVTLPPTPADKISIPNLLDSSNYISCLLMPPICVP